MEVVEVNDYQCHSDGEEVVLLDLDKGNDAADDESPEVHEVTMDDVTVDDVDEAEHRDDNANGIEVIETCGDDSSEVDHIMEAVANIVEEIPAADDCANGTSTNGVPVVTENGTARPSGVDVDEPSMREIKEECVENDDNEVDESIDVVEESIDVVEESVDVIEESVDVIEDMECETNDALEKPMDETKEMDCNTNVTSNETDESSSSKVEEVSETIDNVKAVEKESVTIETKNPDGSIVLKKDNKIVTIPQHIAGRDIKTLNDETPPRSGKRMLNPRFGVKVPYIHMTSQIVTQDEIAKELFERFQQKYPLTRVDKPDKLFSMKLTHRLANKIAPVKSDKKLKDGTKYLKKTVNAKKQLPIRKSGKSNTNKSSITTKSVENSISKIQSSDIQMSEVSNEAVEVVESQHIDQITNTLQSLGQSADQPANNVSEDKNDEKITSNEELIAILEDFENIETTVETNGKEEDVNSVNITDTNSNKVADSVINEAADSNSNTIEDAISNEDADTNGNKVSDKNSNKVADKNSNKVVDTNGNKDKGPETPKQEVKRKIVRSTTRTKRSKPKLDPEIEKQIALKQLLEVSRPKRFDSHYAKRKAEIKKEIIKNDLVIAQKRKKPSSDEVPEVKIAIDQYIKSYTDKRQSTVKMDSNDETVNDNVDEVEPETKTNDVAKARTMREINRLLGDEGAINMIYSLEKRRSPGNNNSKNILPSTRRMKKDLMLKTKLVKNAMLKMSAPTGSALSTNRLGRRSDVCTSSLSPETKCTRKTSIDSQGSDQFINFSGRKTIPADESKIIRKHSSSSEASSIGGSPTLPIADPVPFTMNNEQLPAKVLRVYSRKNKNSDDLSNSLDQTLTEVSKGTNKSVTKTKNVSQKVKKQLVSSIMSRSLAESIKQDVEDTTYNEITIRRYDGVVHITLTPVTTVMKNALNISVMEELMKELNNLETDDTCKVVLMSSAGRIFCQGLDIPPLIQDNSQKCKEVAVEISSTLKKFITCLSDFPKLLVAGVDGAAVGLGATMLVHFDLVFASDKATFETPYAQLGHIAEGAATTILGRLLVAEMIMGSQRLTAGQAHYYGLVTRTLWPDRFHDELIPLVKSLARQSLQAMKTTKALQKQETKEKLAKALETETHILVQQWTSDECQQHLQAYLKDTVDNININ